MSVHDLYMIIFSNLYQGRELNIKYIIIRHKVYNQKYWSVWFAITMLSTWHIMKPLLFMPYGISPSTHYLCHYHPIHTQLLTWVDSIKSGLIWIVTFVRTLPIMVDSNQLALIPTPTENRFELSQFAIILTIWWYKNYLSIFIL